MGEGKIIWYARGSVSDPKWSLTLLEDCRRDECHKHWALHDLSLSHQVGFVVVWI